MASKSGRAAMTVAAPFIALLAGIPFLAAFFVDSLIAHALFGWDTWTVFAVQAVPITIVVVIYAVATAARGELGR
jgi:uncharacterized membrane protein